jgi:hypothetical protein
MLWPASTKEGRSNEQKCQRRVRCYLIIWLFTRLIKIVLAKQRVPFKKVFELAQVQLKTVFGMEMVELPAREKVSLKEKRGMLNTYSTSPYSYKSSCPKDERRRQNIRCLDSYYNSPKRLPYKYYCPTRTHLLLIRRSIIHSNLYLDSFGYPTQPYE